MKTSISIRSFFLGVCGETDISQVLQVLQVHQAIRTMGGAAGNGRQLSSSGPSATLQAGGKMSPAGSVVVWPLVQKFTASTHPGLPCVEKG